MDVLTSAAHRELSVLNTANRAIYDELKFVQFDDFVDADSLRRIVADAVSAGMPYATRTVKPPEISPGLLTGGRRFDRIDWGPHAGNDHTEDEIRAIRGAFDASGLTEFVESLVAAAQPLFEFVVGRRLTFDRTFLLVYREGDFIAPHGDTQTSRRIMVQMPVTFDCKSAFRVLKDGWMEAYYDNPGCVRLMGPGIWHDVLPVLRLHTDSEPQRVLVTARLPYADDEE